MNFKDVVSNLATVNDLKRISSAYVTDYKNIEKEELKAVLLKTAPQYYFFDNIVNSLKQLSLSENRNDRVISQIIIKHMLLNTDDFKTLQKELTDEVINYEQMIVNKSNDFEIDEKKCEGQNLSLYKYVLEAAWERNGDISPDEKNLLEKIRKKLNITEENNHILEASIGKFPLNENKLHTREDIENVRRKLQTLGILFSIRDEEKNTYDIIPVEIVEVLREYFEIEMKEHGYRELISSKHFRNKIYLVNILEKSNINVSNSMKMDELKELCINHIKPSVLLGGYTPRDGLDTSLLSKWCSELHLNVSGQKSELIKRIIDFYDNLRREIKETQDEREIWYKFYDELAYRNLSELRKQNIIVKDIECEKYFERATDYLFENMLMHKPLILKGTEHPDGMLSYQDKLFMWDNKSKEKEVHLLDHIKQFDRYIKKSDKKVSVFLVIGPAFTKESTNIAMQYMLENETVICMITARELKLLAQKWKKSSKSGTNPFPLGYFKQPGEFKLDLVTI